jgi:hypothetical protein
VGRLSAVELPDKHAGGRVKDRFDDECPDCRPIMVDPKTMQPYAADSVEMMAVNQIWSETTLEDRRAFHRFTCQNSRATGDMLRVKGFSDRLEEALAAAGKTKKARS